MIISLQEKNSCKEVEQAVKNLKNGKAVGLDRIPNELLKQGGPSLVSALTDILRLIQATEYIPELWQSEYTSLTGFVIVVVRLSKTTKNRHGQPKIHLWNTLVVRTDNQVYP